MESYILIQTEIGAPESVAESITFLEGVTFAEVVTGPYDIIARARSASEDDLIHSLEERIRAIIGVTRTVACPLAGHERIVEPVFEPATAAV